MIDLTGRVALVTGATRGIGQATAERLLDAGCSVIINGRFETPEVVSMVQAIEARHPARVSVCFGDVADTATLDAVKDILTAYHGRLDVLVNNAGVLRDSLIGMIPDTEVNLVIDTNVVGLLKMTQLAAGFMSRGGGGSIVNMSSIIGRRGNAGQFVYGASKAAVIGATLAAAKELAPLGIRVNAVAPGLIDTAMIEAIPPTSRRRLEENIAMGRIGEAGDVADVALFLASDLSAYVTGQVIGVDGGLVL